jgi:NAD(P)-dependent dehydrogenase (short-subunit alcohol dehydrogenase family)
MDASSKTYVITGATSGIGLATAKALALTGAAVIGVGRSPERCQAEQNRLRAQTNNPNIQYLVADLSRQADVRKLAVEIGGVLSDTGRSALDGLLNNAGVFTYWLTLTPDGIEMQWAVNHLAPFLLTCELLPLLKAAEFARVVTVSSDSHFGGHLDWKDPQMRRHYNGLQAYNNTKLANILFSMEFNRLMADKPAVQAFAADPGLVKTDIGLKGTPALVQRIWKIRRSGGTSPDVPARNMAYLLTEPSIQHAANIYWKDCRPKIPSRSTLDVLASEKLWILSENMCGINPGAENVIL